MELLVINIDFAELGPRALAHLGLERLCLFLVLERGAHLHDAGLLDEVWQVEWGLLYAPLALEILAGRYRMLSVYLLNFREVLWVKRY